MLIGVATCSRGDHAAKQGDHEKRASAVHSAEEKTEPSATSQVAKPPAAGTDSAEPNSGTNTTEAQHHVVYADRVRQVYVLLLPDTSKRSSPEVPRKAELLALVRKATPGLENQPEIKALELYISRDPDDGAAGRLSGNDEERRRTVAQAGFDLLGMSFDVVPRADIIDDAALGDPVLTRKMSNADRASLDHRGNAVVFRGDYRPYAVARGLRLLQTVVLLYAEHVDALIYDADTHETMSPAAFRQHRLRADDRNFADQIAVFPFPDPRHEPDAVRLTTRGMRRFGAPDLEFDSLSRDPRMLQRATAVLEALAEIVAAEAELDPAGYASEASSVLTVQRADIERVQGALSKLSPPCANCAKHVDVHLVERPVEDHDPVGHTVARVVAPREQSDRPEYRHEAWIRAAIAGLFVGSGHGSP